MKILAVGGGSGGHVTPVVAVLRELKKRDASAEIRFWVDKKFANQAKGILHGFDKTIRVDVIASGKFRRYNHVPLWRQFFWPSVVLPNIRDGFKIVGGALQSIWKLIIWRPDVVFTKGGFVCLPVGWAAHLLRIPLVIHDSDAHPGLTNRLLSRWADAIATGAPLHHYSYPKSRSKYVGIPIDERFAPVTEAERKKEKAAWGVSAHRPLLVVTGGGLGATRINDAIVTERTSLTAKASVILVSGMAQYDELKAVLPPNDETFQLHGFTNAMPSLLRAADVVITRAGATTSLELAALAMPTILVPNARLTGGHQVKNAAVYAEENAVQVIDEEAIIETPDVLTSAVAGLLEDTKAAQEMGQRFHAFARPTAAKDMADMIEQAGRHHK